MQGSTVCTVCGHTNSLASPVCATCGQNLRTTQDVNLPLVPQSGALFVGRGRELAFLEEAFAVARTHHGTIVLVGGEAGIGKTALVHAFAETLSHSATPVVWGRNFDGEWQRPYGCWAEALGAYVRSVARDRLKHELGSNVPTLAQLLPNVATLLPTAPPPQPLPPPEERIRLYDAVTQLLLAAAREQPLVVVLDDLHWAEPESLNLLQYVAHFVARARILLVGIYRTPDVDADRNQALQAFLADRVREREGGRLLLHGLSLGEVAAYLRAAAGRPLSDAVLHTVYAETEGSPFYTRELFLHLAEEGKLRQTKGTLAEPTWHTGLGAPVGVRQILAHRLRRLSPETAGLLRLTSAMSGSFSIPLLQVLSGFSEDVLLDCIDEAIAAGFFRLAVPVPAPAGRPLGVYDFAHTIVRHTLYESMNADRKVRLHRRIAEALEQAYAGDLDAVAGELATQYHASLALPGAGKGVAYAVTAARDARTTYAWERAVHLLRMALDLAAASPAPVRAEILCQLAVTQGEALLLEPALETTTAAVAALIETGAAGREIAEFLTQVVRALKEGGASAAQWEPLVDQGLAYLGTAHDLTWARLTLLRDLWEPVVSEGIHYARWLGHDPEAVAIARALGSEDDYAQTLELFDWRTPEQTQAALAQVRTWRSPAAVVHALSALGRDLMFCHSCVQEALECGKELLAVSTRNGSLAGQAEALVILLSVRTFLGDLAVAEQTAHVVRGLTARLGATHRLHPVTDVIISCVLAYYLEGDWNELARRAEAMVTQPMGGRRGLLAPCLAAYAALGYLRQGNTALARDFLARVTPIVRQARPTDYQQGAAVHTAASAVWELGWVEMAPIYRQLGLDLIEAGIVDSPIGSSPLTVARMSALLGDWAEAADYFAAVRQQAERHGMRVARAMADYDEALGLSRAGRGSAEQITALLQQASGGFHNLGMSSWQARALQLQEALPPPDPAPEATPLYPAGLTAREVEVLCLVAGGKTMRQIAADLVISPSTVERHISNIYGKIGASNRAHAVTFALRHGLVQPRQPE